jgi:putative nucleotidyltransferase with HDIG domain
MYLQAILPEVIPEVGELENLEQSPPHREPVLAHTIHVLESLRWIESVLIDGDRLGAPTASQLWMKLGSYQERLRDYFSRPIHGRMDGRGLLRLGALFHDVGKSRTMSIGDDGRIRFIGHEQEGANIADHRLRKLRLSNEAVNHIRKVVLGHMWPFHLVQNKTLTRRAVFRFFKRSGSAGLDIGLLSLADYLATHGGARDGAKWEGHLSVIEQLYDHYFHHYNETVRPVPIINGQQLMQALDIGPGPEIGRLLSVVEEAQAAGEISTEQDAVTLAADNFRKV